MEKKKILIAEDEKSLVNVIKLKLENDGFNVTAVYEGDSVFKELKKGHYDLLILDLIMPGLDGFGVLDRFKKLGYKLPVVVLTNLSQDEDRKRVASLGVNNFIIKSETSIKNVIEQIKKILG